MKKLLVIALFILSLCALIAKVEIPITRVDRPMVIDGSESDWRNIEPLPQPTTYTPVEGKEPQFATDTRIAYDKDYFYIIFIAQIDDPDDLLATVATRENWNNNEQVVFALDVFNSDRGAYLFNFNPYANPKDWISSASGTSDQNWDIPLKSKSQIHQDRFVVEAAIPFASLPFDDSQDEQRWGFYYFRLDKKHNEQSVYPPRTSKLQNIYAQSGVLKGLQGIKSGQQLELLPYVFSSYIHNEKDWEYDGGIDASYSLDSHMTLSATINPDYSQIEADPMNIDINQRDPQWLEEKRPFFTRGMDFFYTDIFSLVYTRNIENPIAGFKLSGKYPSASIGFVSAYDEGKHGEKKDVYNLFRYRKDILEESTVGVLITDREDMASSGFNRVGAVDGFFSLPMNIRIKTQTAYSQDSLTAVPYYMDRDGFETGWAHHTKLEYTSEHNGGDVFFEVIEKNFEPGSGYMSYYDKNMYMLGAYCRNDILDANTLWEEVTLNYGIKNKYDLENNPTNQYAWSSLYFEWKNVANSEITIDVNNETDDYYDENGDFQSSEFSTVRYSFSNWKMFSGSFNAWLNGSFGTSPYFGSACNPAFKGWSYYAEFGFSLDLFDRLAIRPSIQYTDFYMDTMDQRVYQWYKLYNKITFLLSQDLYIRNITQGIYQEEYYPWSDASPEHFTAYSNSLLLTWEYSPLSNVYVGVNFVDFDRWDNVAENTQIFFKGNYLWSL